VWVFQVVVVGDGVVASVVGALRDGGCAPACLLAVQVRFTDWYEMDHAGLVFVLAWCAEVVVGESLACVWGSAFFSFGPIESAGFSVLPVSDGLDVVLEVFDFREEFRPGVVGFFSFGRG